MGAYDWPGNLAELKNAVDFAAVQSTLAASEVITPEHLPGSLARSDKRQHPPTLSDYRLHLARAELDLVERSISQRPGQNKSELADSLGYTDRFAFSRRIRKALNDYPDAAYEFPLVAGRFALRATG